MALEPSLLSRDTMRSYEFAMLRKIIILGLFIVLLYIVWPFIDVLAYSIAFAYMVLPVYKILNKKLKSKNISAVLAIAIYVIPTMIICIYAFNTFINLILSFDPSKIQKIFTTNLLTNNFFIHTNPKSAEFLNKIINNFVNEEFLMKYFDEIVKYIINLLSQKIFDVGYLIVKFVMVVFITFYFLRDGDKIKNLIIKFTPNDYKEKMNIYLTYLHDSYKNLFISCVSISIIITILSYIGYLIASVPYAELFAVITGIFALLPILGGWMVYIPLAIYYFIMQDYTKAIFLFIYGEIFLSIAPDFIIRPYIVKKDVDIHPVLVIVAFLMAPLSLGVSGFAIGPVVVGALNAFYLAKYRDGKI